MEAVGDDTGIDVWKATAIEGNDLLGAELIDCHVEGKQNKLYP